MSRGEAAPGDPVEEQTVAVLRVLDAVLPAGTLIAAALYGSAVDGGLRPDSDLDLFGVLDRRLSDEEKRGLVSGLVPISARPARPRAWRPVELTLVVHREIRPWRYPPRLDFQYGEWLRESLVGGNLAPWPPTNPDVAMLLTMVRSAGIALRGPAPADVLEPVPRSDLVRAMLDELPTLLDDVASDTRNVLLTLARIWVTLETGDIVTKDAAAAWAIERLPPSHRPQLELARAAYLGEADDRWEGLSRVRAAAQAIVARTRAAAILSP